MLALCCHIASIEPVVIKQYCCSFQLATINNSQRYPGMSGSMPTPPCPSMKNCIQLAACSTTELLPMNPELPADLFTACLTTPIKIALRWYVQHARHVGVK